MNVKKFIVVEQKKSVWAVYIANTATRWQAERRFIKEPVKALRYAFLLKAKFNLVITENSFERLMQEYNNSKR